MRKASLCALLLAGCALGNRRDGAGPGEAMARLDRAESAARRDPSLRARAGWLRYLIASDADGAAALLEQAAAEGPAGQRALALDGLGEIAEDRTDSNEAVRRWVQALQVAPRDPAAELAAVRLLDLEGETPAIDDAIARCAAELKAPARPRAARLLREAAARIASRRAQASGDAAAELEAWRQIGAIQHWRVGGPFAPLRLLSLDKPLPLDGAVDSVTHVNDRPLDFPDGDVGLDGEPPDGDIFYAASAVTLDKGGEYLAWLEGAAALEARIDGAVAVSRSPYPREMPRSQAVAVRLAPGAHRVLVRWSRAEGGRFRLALARADGSPSDLHSEAPAELAGARAAATCALGQVCGAAPAWTDATDLRAAAQAQLDRDPSDPLAAWVLARATLGDDRAVSREATEQAVALSAGGAPALTLRAQQALRDPDVPERIGRARALADLSEALRRSPRLLRARLTAAALERDSERYDDAAADLDKAESLLAGTPLPWRLLAARARLLDARGNLAGARAKAGQALLAAPGRCDTLQLLHELAQRGGPLADRQRTAEALLPCPDGIGALVQSLRDRGELTRAEELLRRAVALRPSAPLRLEQLAEMQVARKELPEAVASMRLSVQLSPRGAEPLRRLAGVLELEGESRAATEARRAALRLAPGDLGVRQQISLDDGERVMAWSERDAAPLARTRQASAPEGASAVRLLDYGAVQMFADSGGVERVHTLVRVLDKKGVSRFGEAQIPPDAQVVRLRTLKADGRVLEPEAIPEKEGISMPGLEPGDSVETDYLRGIAPRGSELPGYALGAFFFRDDETPMSESTYEVRAPAPFEVDAHHLPLPGDAITRDGESFRFRYSARDVPALLPEPHSPGEAELMPWVQIGAGAGQKELAKSIADWALLRARPGSGVDELARRSRGRSPEETARNAYAAVAQAVRGRSTGTDFAGSAPHIVAQGRGNRLLALKAVLAAAGVPSHVVLARTFNADQAQYRLPRGELFGYAVLRIDLPAGPLWADPSYRLAPLGQLPSFVRGQEAWVMPEPGEEPTPTLLPASLPGEQDGRSLSLELQLLPDGRARGSGRDEHRGFEAASLKDALERLDADQRKQAVESMLGRGLRGATLESLRAEHEAELGGPATLAYAMSAEIARRDGPDLFVQASLAPSRLTRRWASSGERATALLIDSPELLDSRATLALPPGLHLRKPPRPVALQTPFGAYSWSAREEPAGQLQIEESLRLPQQRVQPPQYAAFQAFARAVDEAQAQELLVSVSEEAQ